MLVAFAGRAGGQDCGPPPAADPTPSAPEDGGTEPRIEITSDGAEFARSGEGRLLGHVVIRQGNRTLTAETATFNAETRDFQVEGAVVCTQAFHLARALMLARAAGIDAVGVVSDQRRYRHEGYNKIREAIARLAAVSDVYVVHRQPKFYGPVIPWSGDARMTHDEATPR